MSWGHQYLGDCDDKGNPVGTKYDQQGNPIGIRWHELPLELLKVGGFILALLILVLWDLVSKKREKVKYTWP